MSLGDKAALDPQALLGDLLPALVSEFLSLAFLSFLHHELDDLIMALLHGEGTDHSL